MTSFPLLCTTEAPGTTTQLTTTGSGGSEAGTKAERRLLVKGRPDPGQEEVSGARQRRMTAQSACITVQTCTYLGICESVYVYFYTYPYSVLFMYFVYAHP